MLKPRRALAPRFDRDAWLQAALEVLARQGQAKLRVETLARQLGVVSKHAPRRTLRDGGLDPGSSPG